MSIRSERCVVYVMCMQGLGQDVVTGVGVGVRCVLDHRRTAVHGGLLGADWGGGGDLSSQNSPPPHTHTQTHTGFATLYVFIHTST